MKIKNNLIFSFIFTGLLTSLIIWNRFIRQRLPREITYHAIFTYQDKIIFLLFLAYFSIWFYYFLKYLKVIPRPNSRFKKILDKFLYYLETKKSVKLFEEFFINHISNGPTNVYNYFYIFIYVKPFIYICGTFLHKYFQLKPIVPYIFGFLLPRFIIITVFLIEIMFFNYLNYFYKVLILYLIPLIFKIVLFMIEHHTKNILDMIHEYFKFKILDEYDNFEIYNKPFNDPIKLKEQENFYYFAKENWLLLQYMYSVNIKIKQEKDKYNNIINIIIYGLYTISFGTYLLKVSGLILS